MKGSGGPWEKQSLWYQEFNIHYKLFWKHSGQQKAFMTLKEHFWNSFCFFFLFWWGWRKPFSHDLSVLFSPQNIFKIVCCVFLLTSKPHKIDIKRQQTRIISEKFHCGSGGSGARNEGGKCEFESFYENFENFPALSNNVLSAFLLWNFSSF